MLSCLCQPERVWRVAQAFLGTATPCYRWLKNSLQLPGHPVALGLVCGKPCDCQALLQRLTAPSLLAL